MLYKDKYHIRTRFRRSANIVSDSDLGDFLANYIVTPSVCNILSLIISGVENKQNAFTLTGPYGGGKSSLCLFLMAVLGNNKKIRDKAMREIPQEHAGTIKAYVEPLRKGFKSIPIIAKENSPIEIIAESLDCEAHADKVLLKIGDLVKKHGRLLIIIDEMGKILEANQDPFFLQTLAEYCNRSNGKVNLIGCMHSAFGEYARGKALHVAEEWRKVQGRFFDISVNTVQDEQTALIGQAIVSTDGVGTRMPKVFQDFARLKNGSASKENRAEVDLLKATYPLHPITTLMLTKYANSGISQSNRSIFTFLSSSEPYGFQEFLNNETIRSGNLYTPDRFYDYVMANFRNTVIVSGSAATFTTAEENLRNLEDSVEATKAIKTIALWQALSPYNQIKMTAQTLAAIYPKSNMRKVIHRLEKEQYIRVEQKHGYIISEMAEFDLEEAKKAIQSEYNIQELRNLDGPRYIDVVIGKQHLFKTGTIRSMDIVVTHFDDTVSIEERPDKIGNFILIIPRNADEEQKAQEALESNALRGNHIYSIACNYKSIGEVTKNLNILRKIDAEFPVLKHDRIARNIIHSLIESEKEALDNEVEQALRKAQWHREGEEIGTLKTKDYSQMCSRLADEVFNRSPIINSELLNKTKVDGGGAAGLRKLMYAMAEKANEERLGLKGYSAEASLYDILLHNSNIHSVFYSEQPYRMPEKNGDPCNIGPLWRATTKKIIKKEKIFSLQEIYDFWSAPPYGVKDGLKPILMLAYILAHGKNIANYIKIDRYEFHTDLDDFFIETLSRRPHEIGLRYVSEEQRHSGVVNTLYDVAMSNPSMPTPEQKEILDIAVSYKRFINDLPPCTKTTDNISREARNFRNVIRNNDDPNKMINTDIKSACPVKKISAIVAELDEYYLKRLATINYHIEKQLGINPKSNGAASKRSNEVYKYALDPNIRRLSQCLQIENWQERTEQIIYMATGKPPQEWNDQLLNASILFINGQIEEFLRIERKIRLQTDEQVLICTRENGEYREFEFRRGDAGVDGLLKRVKNADDE